MIYLNINDRFVFKPNNKSIKTTDFLKTMLPILYDFGLTDRTNIDALSKNIEKANWKNMFMVPSQTVKPLTVSTEKNSAIWKYYSPYNMLSFNDGKWSVTLHLTHKVLILGYMSEDNYSIYKTPVVLEKNGNTYDINSILDILNEYINNYVIPTGQVPSTNTVIPTPNINTPIASNNDVAMPVSVDDTITYPDLSILSNMNNEDLLMTEGGVH